MSSNKWKHASEKRKLIENSSIRKSISSFIAEVY
ncbi:hypothetical protein T05_8480 [Trichinella murrelli]|uniref:Uncharacterized protein n=1 Tax=Trichinella murrelli TaxID=144512 RepID=A0A0V0SUY6_9BILA|nr:hypothetical protein T05_8480 [Trichinella murrelli]